VRVLRVVRARRFVWEDGLAGRFVWEQRERKAGRKCRWADQTALFTMGWADCEGQPGIVKGRQVPATDAP
jgi:hypothetical protein